MAEMRASLNSEWALFLLVFLLSAPFWLVDIVCGRFLQKYIPVDIPFAALQACNPLIAAAILTFFQSGFRGVIELLKRAVDFRKITTKTWYLPIFFLWPAMMVLAYVLMRLAGGALPDPPRIPVSMIPVFLIVFLISATGEQVGWMGFAFDRLRSRWRALSAGIIIGMVWAAWHIVPLSQTSRSTSWIFWQLAGMVPFRILIVWIYNNTNKSVFATIVFQATANVSQFLFPNYGSHYDPFVAFIILAFGAIAVVFLWNPETLASEKQ